MEHCFCADGGEFIKKRGAIIMLCENCYQNEATFHYTEVINGVMTEHHLCSSCASKMGLSGFGDSLGGNFPFVKLLTGLFAASNRAGEEADNPMLHVKCPKCGMNYQEFIRVGKFGCAECYDVFGPLIEDNMKKLQGSIEHKGKRHLDKSEGADNENKNETASKSISGKAAEKKSKSKTDILDEIAVLNAKLKEAIELEEYEDAARYRDEIKALKEGGRDA